MDQNECTCSATNISCFHCTLKQFAKNCRNSSFVSGPDGFRETYRPSRAERIRADRINGINEEQICIIRFWDRGARINNILSFCRKTSAGGDLLAPIARLNSRRQQTIVFNRRLRYYLYNYSFVGQVLRVINFDYLLCLFTSL